MVRKEVLVNKDQGVAKNVSTDRIVTRKVPVKNSSQIDFKSISNKLNGSIKRQRNPLTKLKIKEKSIISANSVKMGIEGLDKLLFKGVPKGSSLLISGGAGSGKTITCLQSLVHHATKGKKCLIMTLEESEERLIEHMEGFGWPAKKLIKKGNLRIVRSDPFDIMRNVDAMMAKQKGELLIDINPIFLPKDFQDPDFIAIDSLTAIASAFTKKDDSYRMYISQLFKFLEKTKIT